MNVCRQPKRPTYAWVEKPEDVGLRFVNYADKIVRLHHKGWFCDEFQDHVMRGVVYRLPHSRGFVAGHSDPYRDGPAFLHLVLAGDERDAAFWADSIAQYEAEQEREYEQRETERLNREEREHEELLAFVDKAEGERPDFYT